MVSRVLNAQLLGCVQPDNKDIVRGLLASIFADAGARTAAKKLEERLYKHDVCRVNLLAQLTRRDLLEDLQMSSEGGPPPTGTLGHGWDTAGTWLGHGWDTAGA
jgi:hypothetical protein